MEKNSLIPLITLWEEFFAKVPEGDILEFASWILAKEEQAQKARPDGNGHPLAGNDDDPSVVKNNQPAGEEMEENARALLLIARLHSFIEMRAKPIVKKHGFTKNREYGMLANIYLLKTPNKKQLAESMLLENSTAVEITNRMLKKGFIMEIDDEEDKRSTRICLTAAGEQKLFESYADLRDLPASFLDSLTGAEITRLVNLLQKVEEAQSEWLRNQ